MEMLHKHIYREHDTDVCLSSPLRLSYAEIYLLIDLDARKLDQLR